jgi:hypothetical protein
MVRLQLSRVLFCFAIGSIVLLNLLVALAGAVALFLPGVPLIALFFLFLVAALWARGPRRRWVEAPKTPTVLAILHAAAVFLMVGFFMAGYATAPLPPRLLLMSMGTGFLAVVIVIARRNDREWAVAVADSQTESHF